jgi:hypothetical protein
MRMLEALQESKNRRILKAIVASICKQAAKDFARGFRAPHLSTAGARRNVRFSRLVGRPDAAALQRINAHLDAITDILAASAQGRGKRIAVSWVVAPQHGREPDL